jgi:hypothetical protein
MENMRNLYFLVAIAVSLAAVGCSSDNGYANATPDKPGSSKMTPVEAGATKAGGGGGPADVKPARPADTDKGP